MNISNFHSAFKHELCDNILQCTVPLQWGAGLGEGFLSLAKILWKCWLSYLAFSPTTRSSVRKKRRKKSWHVTQSLTKAMLDAIWQHCYLYLYNWSAKLGSNQTALMPKLWDGQLTSNVSMIKAMVWHVVLQTTFTRYHKTQQALCKANNNSTFT